jgi:hypothetical protein
MVDLDITRSSTEFEHSTDKVLLVYEFHKLNGSRIPYRHSD